MGLYVRHPSSFRHDTGGHPENASRLRAIEAQLDAREWLGLEVVEAPTATREQLLRVHSAQHLDRIEAFCEEGGGLIDMDTVASIGSWDAALHAAGGPVMAVERLLSGDERFAFCALRPPGHHAESDRAMGFCLLNNVAVATAHALHACDARRVLVLDWDVHHGNGTEAIFATSAEVLYASIHQSPLYPGTGPAEFTGEGEGEGFTLNLPVPPGSGNDVFCGLVEHVVAPVTRAFRPELLAISAGYDAHRADPLAECSVDEAGYATMAVRMRDLAAELDAPILVCLEGGYDPGALARSAAATIDAIQGDARPEPVAADVVAEYLDRERGRVDVVAAGG